MCNEKKTLNELIETIIKEIESTDYASETIKHYKIGFNQLLEAAEELKEIYFTNKLKEYFIDVYAKKHDYRISTIKNNKRCVNIIENYILTNKLYIKKYQPSRLMNISSDFQSLIDDYEKKERDSGLSEASIIKYKRVLSYLFEYMTNQGRVTLSDIKHGDTLAAIENMLNEHYESYSLTTALSGLRKLYSTTPELSKFRLEIPRRIPRKKTIIDTYTEDEEKKIYDYINSGNLSLRDRAICLLSFETGLRGIDICNLMLGDIDWQNNMISLIQKKTNRPLILPLQASYGNAIMKYLLEARPKTEIKNVFITEHAPYKKLKAIHHIIIKCVTNSGIDVNGRPTGPQMFRRHVASTMLKKGINISVISDQLGHSSKDTTMIYISTDKEVMASLTLPLPN